MKETLAHIATHPWAVMMAAFATLFLCYFMFKKIVKLGLFLILLALAIGGYYYFKAPDQTPQNFRQTLQETRNKSAKLLETGKHAYSKGKELFEKSKKLKQDATELFKSKESEQEPQK
jgi:uncharacterized protein HemX